MIIGIDASRANRPQKTGTEWYAYSLMQAMKAMKDDHRYFLYTNTTLRDSLETCPSRWEERVLRWPPVRLWTQIRLSWEMLRRPPDVLFIPSHTIPLMHPKKTVVTIHDIGFERLPELYPWYDRWYHRFAVRFAARHASHILVPSAFTKQELIDVYGIGPERITVVHHGYNRADYRPSEFSIFNFQFSKKYFLYVGRLEKKKNIVGLLHGFADFKKRTNNNHELVLVGKPGFGYREIQDTITSFSLTDSVKEYGWVAQEKMGALMHHATALVLLSFYEGFGLPVLEAMASGVPVIAGSIPALHEVGGDAPIYVSPHHSEMFSEVLEAIATDASLRAMLRDRGLARAAAFSWEKAAEETARALLA